MNKPVQKKVYSIQALLILLIALTFVSILFLYLNDIRINRYINDLRAESPYLNNDIEQGELTIDIFSLPEGKLHKSTWLIIDPYKPECEILFIPYLIEGVNILSDQVETRHKKGTPILVLSEPVFNLESLGLVIGENIAENLRVQNEDVFYKAINAIQQAGGGKIILPPGTIEINYLSFIEFPDNVGIIGSGRSNTLIKAYADYSVIKNPTGVITIDNSTWSNSSFLIEDADASDSYLNIYDDNMFSVGDLIRIRNFSTTIEGNGSWPYDPRPALFNGEFSYVNEIDNINKRLYLDVPIQSSVSYRTLKREVLSRSERGGQTILLNDADGYEVGAKIVVVLEDGEPFITEIVRKENNSIQVDFQLPSAAEAGNPVYIYNEIQTRNMISGLLISEFSLEIVHTNDYTGGLIFHNLDNFQIDNIGVVGAGWAGIKINNSVNGKISNFKIEGGEFQGSQTGYGIQTYHSQWVLISDGFVRGQRRAIDLSGEHPSRYIRVSNNMLLGSDIVEGSSVAGTHGTAEYCTFAENTIIGGDCCGIFIRGNFISIHNNDIFGSGIAAIVISDGEYWDVIGNSISGYQDWPDNLAVSASGEFIRLQSKKAKQLTLSSNSVFLNRAYIDIRHGVTDVLIISRDNIRFNEFYSYTQPIFYIDETSSADVLLDSFAIGCEEIKEGGGNIVIKYDSGIHDCLTGNINDAK